MEFLRPAGRHPKRMPAYGTEALTLFYLSRSRYVVGATHRGHSAYVDIEQRVPETHPLRQSRQDFSTLFQTYTALDFCRALVTSTWSRLDD